MSDQSQLTPTEPFPEEVAAERLKTELGAAIYNVFVLQEENKRLRTELAQKDQIIAGLEGIKQAMLEQEVQ